MSTYLPQVPPLCPNPFCAIGLALEAVRCPKCEEDLPVGLRDALMEVDVAHSGETWTEALDKLEDALSLARRQRYRGLRVIHGVGSGGRSFDQGGLNSSASEDWNGPGRIRREVLNYLEQALADTEASLEPEPHNAGAHIVVFDELISRYER